MVLFCGSAACAAASLVKVHELKTTFSTVFYAVSILYKMVRFFLFNESMVFFLH